MNIILCPGDDCDDKKYCLRYKSKLKYHDLDEDHEFPIAPATTREHCEYYIPVD